MEASLGYRTNSKTAKATQKNPLSKTNKKLTITIKKWDTGR